MLVLLAHENKTIHYINILTAGGFTDMQASDPSKYDLLKKNHLLQKRLVAATQRLAASEGEVLT